MKIQTKIILLVVVISVAIGTVTSILTTRIMRTVLEAELHERAIAVATTSADLMTDHLINGEVLNAQNSLLKIINDMHDIEYAYVVGFDGAIFAHTFQSGFPRALLPADNDLEDVIVKRFQTDDIPILEIAHPIIEGTRSRFFMGIDETHIFQQIENMRNRVLLLTFGMVSLGIVFGFVLSRRIINPLRKLKNSIENFGKGADDLQIPSLKGDNEITDLTSSFNLMVNERVRAENALKYAEERFREMAQNIREVFWLFDWEEQKVIYVSPAYEEIWGRKVQDLYDRYDEWAESIYPEDRAFAQESFRRITETGGGDPREYRIIRPDGTIRWISDRGFVITDEDGQIKRITGIAEDITERKQAEEASRVSEERLRSIFDSASVGIAMVDQEGHVTAVNEADCRFLGYSEEELIGMHFSEFTFSDDLEKDVDLYTSLVKGEIDSYEINKRYVRKDSAIVWGHLGVTLIRDELGNPHYTVVVCEDITERKEAEEEKAKLEAQLLQAQKMEAIGQLAGGVAHDFNNILTAIIGYGDLMKMKMEKGDPLRKNLDQILSSAEKASTLTQSLLAFSRKQIMQPEPVDLNKIIKNVSTLLTRLIGEDIHLKTCLPEAPFIIMADRGQIEQILMNLVTNARDAMPDGGTFIIETDLVLLDEEYTQTHGFGKPGKYALLSMTDTGEGIDQETQKKIFEPFFSTKEVGKGTGLGLAMSYGIVKQHDGYINVYSEIGKGTTFKIYLPITETEEPVETIPDDIEPQGGGETILLAEDDRTLRDLVKTLLQDFGYTVIEASDGDEALEKFKENADHIEMLVLDVIMPKKNGKEVFDEIRKIKPEIKALFASGYSANLIQEKGILKEGLEFLYKPVSPRNLLKKIRAILDR